MSSVSDVICTTKSDDRHSVKACSFDDVDGEILMWLLMMMV